MCTTECLDFVVDALSRDDVRGKAVVEVGSYDANGSPRSLLTAAGPASYLGVDITPGPGVDEVCPAEQLVERYGADAFDLVVSTEMVEHVRPWRTVIANLKRIVRPGGLLLITTRSIGFEYHGWPYDFWRYSAADMRLIFADFDDVVVQDDPGAPGVFVRGRKPHGWVEQPLEAIALHSVVTHRRCVDITDGDLRRFKARRQATHYRRSLTSRLPERHVELLKRALPGLVSPAQRPGAGPVVERVSTSRDLSGWLSSEGT